MAEDSKMKTFSIAQSVRASGFQYWTIRAKSEKDAKKRFKAGEGDFVEEEIEVNELVGEPDVDETDPEDEE